MSGIPAFLLQQLHTTLLNCGPFSNHNELQVVFLDKRISLWRTALPEGSSEASRVDMTIDYLLPKYNRERTNGLVLLLRVLSERTDPDDHCHHRLTETADYLERELCQPGSVNTTNPTNNDPNLDMGDITVVREQAYRLQVKLVTFQETLLIHPKIVLAFKELSAEILQLTNLIADYLHLNPTHPAKRVLRNNIDAISNQCQTVKHELEQALLRVNKEPFDNHLQRPQNALANLSKTLARFTANLERERL